MVKRTFEFVFALLLIIVLAPLFAIVAILIKLDSAGPVFFVQERIGYLGRPFLIYKFRSMEQRSTPQGGSFEPGDNTRVTRVGKCIRKTKIDELPQIFNVLLGNMSLVGPRPEVRSWVDAFPERWQKIHQIKPGITDPASLEFRDEERVLREHRNPEVAYRDLILPRKLDLYDSYIEKRCFLLDFLILFKTLMVPFRG